jgi:hypothetical protein
MQIQMQMPFPTMYTVPYVINSIAMLWPASIYARLASS